MSARFSNHPLSAEWVVFETRLAPLQASEAGRWALSA